MDIKIINNSKHGLPTYKTEGSSGMDLHANIDGKIILKPLERVLVNTGISLELPLGYEAQVRARSGLAIKQGLSLVNGIGTIDSDYRGEIKAILVNLSSEDIEIKDGDRIAQLVITEYTRVNLKEVDSLSETSRGDGALGHTGV